MEIAPLRRERRLGSPVLGFDTEYTSKGAELLCYQLHDGTRGSLHAEDRISIDRLAKACRSYIDPRAPEVVLLAYYSIAELQHMPVLGSAVDVRSFGSSVDVSFYSRRYKLTIRVFDLARFFDRQPLAKVATSFGFEKLTLDAGRDKVTRASMRSAQFRRYAIRDAELCYRIGEELRRGFSPENVDPLYEASPASTAAAAYRLNYLDRKLRPPRSRIRLVSMLGCWGGRAEACYHGRVRRAYEYDLEGAYPRAAIEIGTFPIRGSWSECRAVPKAKHGFGRFTFSFPESCRYPCLPVATKTGQIYPLRGESWATMDEARLARELGARVGVVEAYSYSRGDTSLADYMTRIVGERASTDDPVRRIALKLLANSLIGKFSQRVYDVDLLSLVEFARRKGANANELRALTKDEARALGIPVVARLGSVWMPEWNGLITGRVRAKVGRMAAENDAVYISTDCVWTRLPPKRARIPAHCSLKRSGEALIARTRFASLGDYVAHHSVWRRDAGVKALENMDSEISYEVARPVRLKEAIKRGERFGKWKQETRTASAKWDGKRRLLAGGGTAPWRNVSEYTEAKKADAQSG